MPQRTTLVSLLLFSMTARTQMSGQVTAFKETFDDNSKKWFSGTTDDGVFRAEVHDGVYTLRLEDAEGWRYSFYTYEMPVDSNWTLRARVRLVDAPDEAEFGLIFNTADAENVYVNWYSLGDGGGGGLFGNKAGERHVINGEVELKDVRGDGAWNEIEIRKVNDALGCFINGRYSGGYPYSFYRVFGNKFGFYLYGEITMDIDEVSITRWPLQQKAEVQGAKENAMPQRLSSNVNTEFSELVDCISPDGSVLVFSRRDREAEEDDPASMSDIWWSDRLPDGSWTPAQHLGSPINNETSNFAVAITQDLNSLFVQGIYYSDGTSTTAGGVSLSQRTADGWTMPKSMPIEGYKNKGNTVNSHISPDGQVLLISLWGEDTRGDNDLYVCFRTSDDTWTTPKNLGPVINTIGDDTGPFIAADGKTMYFSSNGWPGYGGRDIFVTVRQDDSWLKWSTPRNLGQPINTDENDSFFQVPAKGDVGYYSSAKESIGSDDIFSIALPEEAKPVPVFLVKGRVLDAETQKPVEADVVYESLQEGKRAGVAHSSPADGAYRVALVRGKQYGVHAEAEGYYSLSDQFDARNLNQYTEAVRDLYLTPITSKASFRLNNVFFDHGKYDLRPESYPELDRLITFLNTNSSVSIELGGHTDNVGSDAANVTLSQNRVNSVKAYLVGKGLSPERIQAKGFGKSKPVATNDTEEGRQLNRRVDFRILN